eukprot:1159421-Pelagomonas_calceolata.AAC.5
MTAKSAKTVCKRTASFCSALHSSPLFSKGCSGATTICVTPNRVSGRVVKEVRVVVGAAPGGLLPPQRRPKVMSAPWWWWWCVRDTKH